ncbi:MAG: LuxR family transcriptional regulator [Moraxellaceae bacterium]|nr:MAG: LuxR family transcriptional regulator [Moraxellaceae bacterium]
MFHRPIEIEMIRADVAKFNKVKTKAGQFSRAFNRQPCSLLKTKLASQWMEEEYGKPAPMPLFGNFWQQNELCILFADTNMGKSILAVQIADTITKNYCMEPFANKADPATRVLYLDFEQGAKQFEIRYVNRKWGSYPFADTFYRAEFDPAGMADVIYYKNYDEFIQNSMEDVVRSTQAEVLIIDNITYMGSATQHATQALQLMKMLKQLKTKYNLSVLVLAHTPKRDGRKPITVNDLQGSKMLINFADSTFAIGQSNSAPAMRYLKQIKQRSQGEMYGESNICLIRLETGEHLLQYKFEGCARERDHLKPALAETLPEQRDAILKLHGQGLSVRKIAGQVGLRYTSVARILRRGHGVE